MPDCYERCYENEEEFDLFDIEDDYDDYYDDYSNSFDDFGVGCDLIWTAQLILAEFRCDQGVKYLFVFLLSFPQNERKLY